MKNGWTRIQAPYESYRLEIGNCYARFHASVHRGVREADGSCKWGASINGRYHQNFPSRDEAIAFVEFELSVEGERFANGFAAYKAQRHENDLSKSVDAMLIARGSNSLTSNGAA